MDLNVPVPAGRPGPVTTGGRGYRNTDGSARFAYTLNNTAIATPRLLAAVVENYQTEDQKIRVPKVLQSYLGGRTEL